MGLFASQLLENPFYFFSWVLIVTFSICVHEYAHALVALKQGDDTAARAGHLTLNPMVQMGPSSLVLLLLLGIAWGSVPVDPRRMRSRGSAALISFAGPAANLLLCVLFGLACVVTGMLTAKSAEPSQAVFFFLWGGTANALLFLFNMLPIPMFDGWSVFSLFFPRMEDIDPQQAQTLSWMLLMAVWVTPVGDVLWTGGAAISATVMSGWTALFSVFL
jgi:Zn-dependent protease